ncbi:MAG: hypothetical protein NUV88_01010 [Candidatus Kaiserbacteria bacterium]|nr:hypothetical protein [Candidatus Kaiserbacteria bacterium]
MAKEEQRCERLFEIAMHGIASFYRDRDAALALLNEFVEKSASKIAAWAPIMQRSRRELTMFDDRKDSGLPLREQDLKVLSRALFPQSGSNRGRTPASYKVDRAYHGTGNK